MCTTVVDTALHDHNTPWVLDGARLDPDQLLPDRARDGSHTIGARRNLDVLAEVTYPVDRANNSSGT